MDEFTGGGSSMRSFPADTFSPGIEQRGAAGIGKSEKALLESFGRSQYSERGSSTMGGRIRGGEPWIQRGRSRSSIAGSCSRGSRSKRTGAVGWVSPSACSHQTYAIEVGRPSLFVGICSMRRHHGFIPLWWGWITARRFFGQKEGHTHYRGRGTQYVAERQDKN